MHELKILRQSETAFYEWEERYIKCADFFTKAWKKTIKCTFKKCGNKLLLQVFLARLHEVHRAIAVTPVVHVPVPVRVRVRVHVPVRVTLALKFSRSPYLDNHSSESIHTWTIDTL